MELEPTNGNKRIIKLLPDLDGTILEHEEIAVKHGITIYNFKYLLRKMSDLGVIKISRTRDGKGFLSRSFCEVLVWPTLKKKTGKKSAEETP